MLLLHPSPTCANANVDPQLVLVVFFLPSTAHVHMVVIIYYNLHCSWCMVFSFQPLAGANTLFVLPVAQMHGTFSPGMGVRNWNCV